EIVYDAHQHRVEHVDEEEADGGDEDQRPVGGGQQAVDKGLHGGGEGELEQAEQHRGTEIDQQQAAIGTVIGEEAAPSIGYLVASARPATNWSSIHGMLSGEGAEVAIT